MRSTLAECEAAPQAGEAKRCATSLESMVEFAASSLGTRDVHAVSTEVISTLTPTPRQAYRVEAVRPVPVSGGDMVACHGMAYAYAVFGCHTTTAAAYTVTLAGADGTKAEALAACHTDAAPRVAEAYKRLGVAPGSVPVCHFLPQDDMLWVAAAGASHAASPAEMYWKIALPTSPMPGAIRDLISPASSVGSASKEDTVGNVFFLEKDLFPGSKMALHFTRATAGAAPQAGHTKRCATSLESMVELPEILSQLSIPAGSPTADAMRSTLAVCEAARIASETAPKHKHYCATSLESMVELVASSLGTRDVHAVSTEHGTPTPRQAYRVEAVRPVAVPGGDMVACHGMPYAYAVFGLHGLKGAAYTVTLAGADGTVAQAVAACHGDVDGHGAVAEAYKRLGVAPGSVAICHFLPQDDMIWVRN
uniref:BURP domain-containing protein n=1 Tax=Oryza barthii TaxID=65489 RepID=A0A0D3G4J0_9ORYZ